MFLKNFFGEILQLEDALQDKIKLLKNILGKGENLKEFQEYNKDDAKIIECFKEEIKNKYGIPKNIQRIFIQNNNIILSIAGEIQATVENSIPIPNEFSELGATQKDFSYFYSKCESAEITKKCLFPYLYSENDKEEINFEKINKEEIYNIESYLQDIPQSRKLQILQHFDSYINHFLN